MTSWPRYLPSSQPLSLLEGASPGSRERHAPRDAEPSKERAPSPVPNTQKNLEGARFPFPVCPVCYWWGPELLMVRAAAGAPVPRSDGGQQGSIIAASDVKSYLLHFFSGKIINQLHLY